MIKSLTDLIYDFLWDGKPDKVSRKQICKEYLEGGLKMIDINKFLKSLKSTWIRHLLKDSDAPWAHLIKYRLNVSHKLTIFGPPSKHDHMGPMWAIGGQIAIWVL